MKNIDIKQQILLLKNDQLLVKKVQVQANKTNKAKKDYDKESKKLDSLFAELKKIREQF
ncbi:MAG: hypothetical protein JJV94_08460 [Sulfurospirillum sp.]|nr:hypothetical protein [Sulfurospirillum sp.]